MDRHDRPVDVLWEDGERLYRRIWRDMDDGGRREFLVAQPCAEHPTPDTVNRLAHEYGLKDYLDSAWALRPLELVRERAQTMLVLEPTRARPLDEMIGPGLPVGTFLRVAITVTNAVARLHQRCLVHKDIKASNILIDPESGDARLTGFGIASRLPRERQTIEAPEYIAGTLSHMAPEQTGRMNRSIDSRSDLYSLGITFYHALTGSLPFMAAEPMEWVHCHVARKPAPLKTDLEEIPPQLAAIIMKLLMKTPEERYQTAAGIERDLRRCLDDWDSRGAIGEFSLGEGDQSDRLLIPEKLYGRDREIELLLAAFDAAVASARPQLVLVSGYSGIGKSSVVGELHKALVPSRGLFASGKFDQLRRDVPYATLAQAVQSLIRQLLGKPEAELTEWREQLRRALNPNGALVIDLIPELKFMIGEQPPVPDVPPAEAKARVQTTLRRLLGVFARVEHPLVLFLDDLQWLDSPTLDLLENILVQPEPQHLLLVGAYRNNEVDAAHPLTRKLSAIRENGAVVHEIVLGPVEPHDLTHWFADALRCPHGQALPLAQLVHEKTGGNPFFANQFLQELVEDDLIRFEPRNARWRWDLGPIRAKSYTDNVVDLMVGKLSRLPLTAQDALKALAYLGNGADTSTLAMVHESSEEQLHADLWEVLRLELIVRADDSYQFVHDRVQEAAYSLVPEEQRAARHLRIARLLTTRTAADSGEGTLFEIVGHFNRASALVTSRDEREQVAALNLTAGKRAKKAAAFASALTYLTSGTALLDKDRSQRHDLVFEFELHRAECEFLIGEVASAEQRLKTLSSRAASVVERAAVVCLQADIYWALQRPERGLEEAADCLRRAGLDMPLRPTEAQTRAVYTRLLSKLDGVGIDEIAALPLMSDPTSRAMLDVLGKMSTAAATMGDNVQLLIASNAVDLTLQRGTHDGSCFAFVWLGYLAGWRYGNFDACFRFGQLGYELIERKGLRRFEGYICLMFSSLMMPWAKHVLTCRPVIDRTFEVCHNTGDRIWAVASRNILLSNLLLAGDPLVDVDREAEGSLAFCKTAAFADYTDAVATQAALVRSLRGLTLQFGSLDDEQFDERRLEHHFATQLHIEPIECWYWIRKLQARFLAGHYAAALEASHHAQGLLTKSPGMLERAEHELYSALAHAAVCDSASSDEGRQHVKAIAAHHRQLEVWARHCPENFENRALLVAAEIARIEGRDPDATRLYEHAIRSARENGFVNSEALALEIAARFYAGRGLDRIARAYMRDARDCYRQWGADGKVQQLKAQYPYLTDERPSSDPTRTVLTSVEHLDLSTVLKLSQAVQGETDLEKLIAAVMRLGLEHAGAERGLLLLPHDDTYRMEAEAWSSNEGVSVDLRQSSVGPEDLPHSVLQYVLRTRERVLLQDAGAPSEFADDWYLRRHRVRSVLCLPLLKQTRLVGIIYLENNLTSGVFTPARMAVLEVLASDAAISLENARLYRDLQEREERVRRLIDANIIGVFTWHVDGRVFDANDEFLRIIGYSREDFRSSGVRWTDFTLRSWRERDLGALAELREGAFQRAEERELVRKDGTCVPVLTGGSMFGGTPDQGVAFVVDLTERKQAELALRESEREARLIVATIPGMVASLTPAGEVEFVNKELVEFCGQGLDDMKQWGTNGTIHVDDLPHVVELFTQGITSGEPYDFDTRIRRFDGVYRWLQIRGLPLRDMGGQVVRWYVLLSDIDDRKRAEAELRALKDQLYKENLVLRDEVDRTSMFEEIVGTSPALQPVLARVAKVAGTDSTVLITGETGTGKELVARAIHRRSARASRAFVSVNCAAIPRELIASELFGHEKGAFTGATERRLGRFELAHAGTLFLDEVGDLPSETQVMLLRVLQEREFARVGGTTSVRVDVRVVAATNRDLQAAIEAGTFRSDLFYRLNVFPIAVPALRERADDIPLLVEYFIDRYARNAGKTIRRVNTRTLDHLRSYPWPGNVRELQNVIERSVIVCDTDEFTIDESWLSTAPAKDSRVLSSTLANHERTIIEDALRASGGRVFGPSGAAARLGIARSTLESKIRMLGIDKNRFRPRRR